MGNELSAEGSPNLLYQRWIATYGSEEFGAAVHDVLGLVDRLGEGLRQEDELRIRRHVVRACRYEWMFWDAAWRLERWPEQSRAILRGKFPVYQSRRVFQMASAARRANAWTVLVGLTAPPVGNTEPSTTKRFGDVVGPPEGVDDRRRRIVAHPSRAEEVPPEDRRESQVSYLGRSAGLEKFACSRDPGCPSFLEFSASW